MDIDDLGQVLNEYASRLKVPGASAAVLADGREQRAGYGVTSIENPLPVNEQTLFQSGSIGKTFTATAILRLAERGDLELDAPVRRYVPTLRLKDADALAAVTVAHLLNHTAGWDGDFLVNTGPGDDALARYVERMIEIDQVTPVGATVSYNNTSLSLAGRIIELITGTTFEQAMADLVLGPVGLKETFFSADDIMTRRFAVGHQRHQDGRITVLRPWGMSRASSPAGGMSTTAADLIRWGRFHLGDGRAADGTRVLSAELLQRMQQPTVSMAGSALGDHVGISWLLRDVDGVRIVGHGGDTLGQHAELVLVPSRGLVFTCLSNSSPDGPALNTEMARWALGTFAGVDDRDPEPGLRDPASLAEYEGTYETVAAVCTITAEGDRLMARSSIKPEMLKELGVEDPGEDEPIPLGLIGTEGDRYVVTSGPAKGMLGYFQRDTRGTIEAVHLGGRLAERVRASVPATGEAR